jgi:autotransporter passenger strand-loop-strand repeat protein
LSSSQFIGNLVSATISGGLVEIGTNGSWSTLTFAASGGGTVQLDQPTNYTGLGAQISGFGSGDDIDFRAIAFSGSVLSWNQIVGSGANASGTLTVSNGGSSADITLLGNYTGGQALTVNSGQTSAGLIVGRGPQFASASDGAGGTDVTSSPVFSRVLVRGGVVSNAIVNNGGVIAVGPGTDSGTVVNNGGIETVQGGGTAIGTVIGNGGSQGVGGTAISSLVSGGGVQVLVPAGVASNTTVLNGGKLSQTGGTFIHAVLSSGGTAIVFWALGTTVLSGATQTVFVSSATSGTVLNGGTQIVSGNGQSAAEQLALVNSGGFELVSTSGTLASATISGGTVEIGNGGQLSGTASFATSGGGTVQLDQAISYASGSAVVSGFALGDFIDFRAIASSGSVLSWNQIVSSGASASGTLTVSNGGSAASITLDGNYVAVGSVTISNGVTSSGLVAASGFGSAGDGSGGTQVTFGANIQTIVVSNGGVVRNAIVNDGGLLLIRGGGTDSGGTVVNNGGSETTQAFGTAIGTIVANGGVQTIAGTAISALVSSGGEQVLDGTGSNTTVLNGGLLVVGVGGAAISAVLSSGASMSLINGGASGTVLNGGTEIVSGQQFASAVEQRALVNNGGLELVESRGILDSATISGGTVEIGGGGQLSGTASFAISGGGTVQLDQAISYASAGAVVSGFTLGDFIDFRVVGYTSGATSATWNQLTSGANASGTLTVSSGGTSADITLLGQYLQGNFKISDDTHGGTVVADPPVVAQVDLLVNPHST